jgi:hypothetical protein
MGPHPRLSKKISASAWQRGWYKSLTAPLTSWLQPSVQSLPSTLPVSVVPASVLKLSSFATAIFQAQQVSSGAQAQIVSPAQSSLLLFPELFLPHFISSSFTSSYLNFIKLTAIQLHSHHQAHRTIQPRTTTTTFRMKPTTLLLAAAPLALALPVPTPEEAAELAARGYADYGSYKGAGSGTGTTTGTYSSYGNYAGTAPAGTYGSYGSYAGAGASSAPAGTYGSYGSYGAASSSAPAGSYGSYGSYPAPSGGYGSYGAYKRVAEWVRSLFGGAPAAAEAEVEASKE